MHIITQRPKECHLATLCMLGGLNQVGYESLSNYLPLETKLSWDSIDRSSLTPIVCNLLNVPEEVANIGISIACLTGTSPDNLDLSGKGHLVIKFKSGSGHSLAFEDGIMFDPGLHIKCTWPEWQHDMLPNYLSEKIDSVIVKKI